MKRRYALARYYIDVSLLKLAQVCFMDAVWVQHWAFHHEILKANAEKIK